MPQNSLGVFANFYRRQQPVTHLESLPKIKDETIQKYFKSLDNTIFACKSKGQNAILTRISIVGGTFCRFFYAKTFF